jgi:hypothetical protein
MYTAQEAQRAAGVARAQAEAAFDAALSAAREEIRRAVGRGAHAAAFCVPAWQWGQPRYELADAAEFVARRLREGGFEVAVCAPWVLIGWRPPQSAAGSSQGVRRGGRTRAGRGRGSRAGRRPADPYAVA